ncbi:MAG: radical SAM family heme chaperone HemW [Calditrichaeota bacterium]|nr:radical SAM family heme chaperone HemW [Calditrichota bacterium]
MEAFSIYIHYPFCLKRCPYCGFASSVDDRKLAERYRRALQQELVYRAKEPRWYNKSLQSIYFGGGTPSLMPNEYIARLISQIMQSFNCLPELEITLEVNPETRDANQFAFLRTAGVNRLSIGAQSFQPDELEFLGRIHSVEAVYETVQMARQAGFDNLSLDLIYGISGQTVESFNASIQKALDLRIEHISTYTLSIDEETHFAQEINAGRMPKPDGDLMADQYAALIEIMSNADFEHYELTNYARPGFRSRHNSAYWTHQHYLGLGCSAHSFDGEKRFWNARYIKKYIRNIGNSVKYSKANTDDYCANYRDGLAEGEEFLTPEMHQIEEFYLGLRTSTGVDLDSMADYINIPELNRLLEAGFIEILDRRLYAVEAHWLMLDEIILRLINTS